MGGRKKDVENLNSLPKGILKRENRITFKNLPSMDDSSDEIEPIELRGNNDAEKKSESVRISSRVVSAYEPCPTETGFKTLSSLIVLKVLILDIGLSLVDVVSDFMQVRLVSLDKPGLELLNLVTGQTRTRTVKLGDWTNQD
ncbi:uncharacterized protein LOC111709250 [Eurytemora carolleeae]|uniref:uncharacterized protein LOC111709250 n=1 Tax=Eurytemora carolleeae TaxID=1294199 RepID=UPI000C79477F|nr:uncharacterized protein LOC111709250 [Eurytemora carolleeae]|eukprot:XP_023338646.1 uncharacterized protein LOC111709250 [Eurytemora affinis]